MRTRGVWILAAVSLLAALAGCDFLLAVAPGISPPTQTVAIDPTLGHAVATWELAGNGPVVVDFGDGDSAEYKLRLDSPTEIAHRYLVTGTYRATIRQGSLSDTAEVLVTVDGPDVMAPDWWNGNYVQERERLDFGIQRRPHGCDGGTGSPLYYTGILPGAGTTWFRIFGYDNHGNRISLFNEAGEPVWGEWIEFDASPGAVQKITCWAWWTDPEPPYPMVPVPYPRALEAKTCPPDTGDWDDPQIPDDAPRMVFTLQARNEWITSEELYPTDKWRIAVQLDSCG